MAPTNTVRITSPAGMAKLGRKLGGQLTGGEIIALIGPLGSGKTTLTTGILAGAGVKGGGSPTFILDAVYKIKKAGALSEIHHLDLYRLTDPQELITLGLYDIIDRPDVATIIEWADRFPIAANQGKLIIEIAPFEANKRSVKLTATDAKHGQLIQNLRRDSG